MKSKITLKELAKLLNVSVSTVSKSLNDSSEISPKTVQRVKELAVLHNYKPNLTAVNLKKNRTGNIAVIVPNISNTFFARVLGGVETEARRLGFQVITYISNESHQMEKQIAEIISNGIVDGLLISIAEETQIKKDYRHLLQLVEYEIPVVLFDRINVDLDMDKVGVNDKGSIYDAVKFMCSKNLKKIALVCALGEVGLAKPRIAGYKAACKDFDLPVNDSFIIVSPDVSTLKDKLNTLLKEEQIEAIIALDYLGTMLSSRIVQENNRKIPEQIKIIGYVNEDFAPLLWPSLSYINQHPMEIGEMAAGLLVERIQDKKSKVSSDRILKTEFVHLDSTRF